MCENFLNFVPVTDINGTILSNVIFNFLDYSRIDCAYLFGQDYNGASIL